MLFENFGNPRLQTALNFAALESPDYGANLGFAEWESFTEVNPMVGILQVLRQHIPNSLPGDGEV